MSPHFPKFLKVGHRGARGLMPENSISSMIQAINDGANSIELDVHISRDEKVIVSHDPILNPKFALDPERKELPEAAENLVLYQMDYNQILQYDVGSKFNPCFPRQQPGPEHIPELGELIDKVEEHLSQNSFSPIIYTIEIKSDPEKDGIYQPEPGKYTELVMEVLQKKLDPARYQILSFDLRQLQELHKSYPAVVVGMLTENNKRSLREDLKLLGFIPQLYSPNFHLSTPERIREAQAAGMKFLPWTVNDLEDMKRLKSMGVDGIITDYPHLLKKI